MKKLNILLVALAFVAVVAAGYSSTKAPAQKAKAPDCCTGAACCTGGACCQ